jgi:hypothetical protein
MLPAVPGPIIHVDKADGAAGCQSLSKVIVEEYALAACDILAISDSGIGKMASFLRGRDDELYFVPYKEKVTNFPPTSRRVKLIKEW